MHLPPTANIPALDALPETDQAVPHRGGLSGFGADAVRSVRQQIIETLFASDDRQRAKRDAVIAFSVRVASAALLYLTQILLARWMGGFEYGIYVFVWTWVLVLGGLAPIGMNLSIIRLLPEYQERGEHALARGLLRGSRLLSVTIASALAALGVAVLTVFDGLLADYYVLPAYLVMIAIPMFCLTDMQDGIGRAQSWMAVALVPPYILRPLLLLAGMALAHTMGLPTTAATAAAAAVGATWATAVIQALVIRWRLPDELRRGERNYAVQPWLAVSLPLSVMIACDLALQNVDILVISKFMTPVDVGIYFAAAKTMSLIMFVHYAVGSAVANRFAKLNARGDRAALQELVKDAVNWTFWPSLLSALVILALGKPLLWLFGPEFEHGYPVMLILVLGFMFRSSFGPVEFLLNMLGEQKKCAAILVLSAFATIALNFALVPIYGMMGAAIATSISLALAPLLHALVARRALSLETAIWHNLPSRS